MIVRVMEFCPPTALREEARLRETFGEAYADYGRRVGRWL